MGRRATLALLALCAPSFADAAPERDLADLPLEELLEIEVVTASAAPQSVAEVPSTVYVFTEDMIRRRGYRSLPELLADVPELQFHWKAVPDYGELVTVRGISGAGTEKLLILYDGVRVDGAGTTPVSVAHAYSLANVERVEVVLGPVSAVYGPDAVTAVVNVRTRGGGELDGGRVSMAAGRFGTYEGSMVAGVERGGVALAVTAATRYTDEPYLPAYYPEDFAWYRERYRTGGEMRAAPGSDEVVTVPVQPWATPTFDRMLAARLDAGSFRLGVMRIDHGHSSTLPIDPSIGLYIADATWRYAITSAVAEHRHEAKGGRFELVTTLSAHRYETAPETAFVNVFSNYTRGYKYEQYDTTELRARLRHRVSDRLTLTAGGTLDNVTGLAETGDLARPFDRDLPAVMQGHVYPGSDIVDRDGNSLAVPQDFFDMRERAIGGYLEAAAQPHRKVSVTAGARLDHHSRYGRSLTPRAGVVVTPDEHTHVKLLYGQAFLAPSPVQTFLHHGSFEPVRDGAGEIVGLRSIFFRLPNPELAPERIRMGELIGFRTIGGLRLGANGYVAEVRDRFGSGFLTDQEFKGWPVASVLIPVNLDETVVTYGATAGLDGRRTHGAWTARAALAYSITGGERGEDPLPATSRHLFKGAVDVERGGLSLSVRGQVRSSARHPETRDAGGALVSIDGAVLLDAHLRWEGVLPDRRARTTLWLDVHNLLDARHHSVSAAFDHLPGVPQDPLRVMVGVDAEL